jgi:hypothetical protein
MKAAPARLVMLPARNAANHSGTRRSGRQRCGANDLQKSRDNRATAAKALGARDLSVYFPTTVYLSSQTVDKS